MLLAINVSYIAGLRNTIGGKEPDLIKCSRLCEHVGASSILVPFNINNQTVSQQELFTLKKALKSKLVLLIEMNEQNQEFAIKLKPDFVCIVPSTKKLDVFESTLNSEKYSKELNEFMIPLLYNKVSTSVFTDPEIDKITAVYKTGLQGVIISARRFVEAFNSGDWQAEFTQLKEAVILGQTLGLKVIVDGGINFDNVYKIREIPHLQEISVGHSIITKSIFDGLSETVKAMKDIINYENK